MLKDQDIRTLLIERIQRQNEKVNYRIIHEMAVCDGQARVDIAVANGKLYGYEIKSDADTLDRLGFQKECYDKTFDRIYIAVGKRFQSVIEEHIPSWWGIYVVETRLNGSASLVERKKAKHNHHIETQSLLDLLWHEEVKELLVQNGFRGLSGKNRRVLRSIALENLSMSVVRNYTRETLKRRTDWR